MARVDIVYGSCVSAEEFAKAKSLRWIHVPSPFVDAVTAVIRC